MKITLNGTVREILPNLSLEQLLKQLAVPDGPIAVERNGEIVPRSDYADTVLSDGDRLEIVQAIGGG